ncbi:hypothetical protein [Actinocatenispora rupis]|uniref:Luciferase-like monooxygenase n=1 Tax=Actinocatenispora rupis TaxID=519421 RepID=A0A8J3JES3_9ACTN|nr:hypothetical protein [Actinocatenispora rupis]GID14608.1 hypothetical protein Aru02nite_54970 [Actinocatenispora rupis]
MIGTYGGIVGAASLLARLLKRRPPRAIDRARAQFRWFAGGWKVNAELPGTAAFAAATRFVRREDVADNIPCGPRVRPIVDAVREYRGAGFTDVAVCQIGDRTQREFLRFADDTLLPALKESMA